MSLKQYREFRTNVPGATDYKEDHPREIAEQELVPQIVANSRNAVAVDRHYFYFFQRKRTGRRCSCQAVETSPDGLCQICYGTGTVGGFDKFGYESFLIDWTSQKLNTVNLVPSFITTADVRPTYFTMADNATTGFLETTVEIRPNRNKVDTVSINAFRQSKDNRITVYIKAPHESQFVKLTTNNLTPRLVNRSLNIRVEFVKNNPEEQTPILSHIFCRYAVMDNPTIAVDFPRLQESILLAEYGIHDNFSTQTFYIADSLQRVTTEDFFHQIDSGQRWKPIEVNPNKPLNILTSHDLVCRVCQNFEMYTKVV